MWRHYVYIHRRLDTNKIFYVGKGSHGVNEKQQTFKRALAYEKRNYHWNNITNKTEYHIEIICSCKNDLEAQKIEKELIAVIGRKNLCNMTDGGEGSAGIIISEETRRKRSIASSGPRSETWVNSIRAARKNGGNGGVVKKGDKLSDSWRQNISDGVRGGRNSMFGRTGEFHPASKLVLNLENGVYYYSINEAALAHNVNPKMLYQYLDGSRINKTNLVNI